MDFVTLRQSGRFFPQYGLASMQNRQGYRWADLVAWVSRLPGSDAHVMALTRTVRQVCRHGDSHDKAMRHPFCTICAGEALAQFDGTEDDLLVLYYRNLYDINEALSKMKRRDDRNAAIA